MSYKIDFAAADVQWQIMALQQFPEIANKHFYPAMHRATSAIKAAVEPNIPYKYGTVKSEFRTAVSGKGMNITGRVGWWGDIEGWYVNVLEYGAKPHPQGYIPALQISIKKHPGISARRFMEKGRRNAQSETDPEMARAAEAVVNELAKK